MVAHPMADVGKPKSSYVRAAKTVFWSFFGIRRKADYQADVTQLKPAQVIVAGLLGAIMLVGVLALLVYLVTK
jgi:hypothetical protein